MVTRNFAFKLILMDRPEGLGEKGLGKKQALIYENLRDGLCMRSDHMALQHKAIPTTMENMHGRLNYPARG